MTRPFRRYPLLIVGLAWFALTWVQTASAWHAAEHATHGHETDEIACDLFAGSAEQPAVLTFDVDASTAESSESLISTHKADPGLSVAYRYRSRAPPSLFKNAA